MPGAFNSLSACCLRISYFCGENVVNDCVCDSVWRVGGWGLGACVRMARHNEYRQDYFLMKITAKS